MWKTNEGNRRTKLENDIWLWKSNNSWNMSLGSNITSCQRTWVSQEGLYVTVSVTHQQCTLHSCNKISFLTVFLLLIVSISRFWEHLIVHKETFEPKLLPVCIDLNAPSLEVVREILQVWWNVCVWDTSCLVFLKHWSCFKTPKLCHSQYITKLKMCNDEKAVIF